jgi:hypothetical protein
MHLLLAVGLKNVALDIENCRWINGYKSAFKGKYNGELTRFANLLGLN